MSYNIVHEFIHTFLCYNVDLFVSRLGTRGAGVPEIKSHPFFKDTNWLEIFEKRVKPPYLPECNVVNLEEIKPKAPYRFKFSRQDDCKNYFKDF